MESDRTNDNNNLWNLGFETIKELETELGILASGKEEIYGCIFGRDSLITSLKLLRVYEHTKDEYFLSLVRKILFNLASLQGKEINIESGEEPGKCIHEYRPSNHEHLTQKKRKPWFVYPDNAMRNYDSVDSTPLFLIASYRYWQLSSDNSFIDLLKDNILLGLRWILYFGDTNADGFIDYRLHPDRKFGGLVTQSWMDSKESVFHEDGSAVTYPIAPVEAQAYTYLALNLWSNVFADINPMLDSELKATARTLKVKFNEKYVMHDDYGLIVASAIDGAGKPLTSARSTMGHVLWASLEYEKDGKRESILNDDYIPELVARLMKPDIFAPKAGLRTLSSRSRCYSPNSYHNGSIWPHDTSLVASGFDTFGFHEEASHVRTALLSALNHFQTPIELFVYDEDYTEYCSPHGQKACKKQAWAAASLLRDVTALHQATPQSQVSV